MRPSVYLLFAVSLVSLVSGLLMYGVIDKNNSYELSVRESRKTVMALGLSDLAISTEARYTRHPAASDGVVPFMDHPGGLEHFPSGSFFQPIQKQ